MVAAYLETESYVNCEIPVLTEVCLLIVAYGQHVGGADIEAVDAELKAEAPVEGHLLLYLAFYFITAAFYLVLAGDAEVHVYAGHGADAEFPVGCCKSIAHIEGESDEVCFALEESIVARAEIGVIVEGSGAVADACAGEDAPVGMHEVVVGACGDGECVVGASYAVHLGQKAVLGAHGYGSAVAVVIHRLCGARQAQADKGRQEK